MQKVMRFLGMMQRNIDGRWKFIAFVVENPIILSIDTSNSVCRIFPR
jgi:hypothetical protein